MARHFVPRSERVRQASAAAREADESPNHTHRSPPGCERRVLRSTDVHPRARPAAARAAGATGQILVRGDSAYGTSVVVPACRKAGARFSVVLTKDPAVSRAIASIPDDAWVAVHYPGAVVDPDTGELISDAEVAEVEFTAFASTKHPVTARLIVRRVRDRARLDELFPVWRHHPFLTDNTEPTAQADITHRRHAITETVFADLPGLEGGRSWDATRSRSCTGRSTLIAWWPGRKHARPEMARDADTCEPAHRPQPGFEPTMVGLLRCLRIGRLGAVPPAPGPRPGPDTRCSGRSPRAAPTGATSPRASSRS
jgi:hypothetical protein